MPSSYASLKLASSPAPIAYYRMNETSGSVAHDFTGNGYDATLTGSFTLGQSGLIAGESDTAIFFADGASGLRLPSSLNSTSWSALSLDFWIDIGSGPQYVAVTCDGSTTATYLNGQPASTTLGGTIEIGSLLDYAGSSQPGSLDEIALYKNAVLTEEQISFFFQVGRAAFSPVVGWYATSPLAPLSAQALTGSGYGGTVPLGTTSTPVTVRVYNNFSAAPGISDALNCQLAVYDDTTYAGQAINPSTAGGYVQVQVADYNGVATGADSQFFAIGGSTKHPVPTNGGTLTGTTGSNYLTVVVQLAVPIDASEGAISPGLWLEYSSTS